MGWWSPDPRGVLLPGRLRVSRSLRRTVRRLRDPGRHRLRAGRRRCADPSAGRALDHPADRPRLRRLHQLGWAHSVETWQDGELVGGLYGVAIGGLFAGESMFHHAPDASKVALVALIELLAPTATPDG